MRTGTVIPLSSAAVMLKSKQQEERRRRERLGSGATSADLIELRETQIRFESPEKARSTASHLFSKALILAYPSLLNAMTCPTYGHIKRLGVPNASLNRTFEQFGALLDENVTPALSKMPPEVGAEFHALRGAWDGMMKQTEAMAGRGSGAGVRRATLRVQQSVPILRRMVPFFVEHTDPQRLRLCDLARIYAMLDELV